MSIIHIYALLGLAMLLWMACIWRLLWLQSLTTRLAPISVHLERVPCLCTQEAKNFRQSPLFNLTFFLGTLAINVGLLLRKPSEFLGHVGGVAAVNINVLLLLSARHSPYLVLIAASQPELLWAHHALGCATVVQLACHYGRVFQGVWGRRTTPKLTRPALYGARAPLLLVSDPSIVAGSRRWRLTGEGGAVDRMHGGILSSEVQTRVGRAPSPLLSPASLLAGSGHPHQCPCECHNGGIGKRAILCFRQWSAGDGDADRPVPEAPS